MITSQDGCCPNTIVITQGGILLCILKQGIDNSLGWPPTHDLRVTQDVA